jgi:L-rhamnose isomerase
VYYIPLLIEILSLHQGLDLPSLLIESDKRNIAFEELLAMPENDDWVYSDGKSTSCVAFILATYKAAGLFDGFLDSIQVTEFTVCLSSLSLHTPTHKVKDMHASPMCTSWFSWEHRKIYMSWTVSAFKIKQLLSI